MNVGKTRPETGTGQEPNTASLQMNIRPEIGVAETVKVSEGLE